MWTAGASGSGRGAVLAVCVFLALSTWAVFGQTLRYGFVNYDDGDYVYENPHVVEGLTPDAVVWAFTRIHDHNWHPLTWMSHMLDVQLHGLDPAGHHLTSVVLHGVAAILLFLALRRMTGCLWRSAVVAALFAVHPLRAESVAWVAERKDVLSGTFFMLTLLAYDGYVHRPESRARYLVVALAFAMGLLCKPMLVTLPLLLLLLDSWPLGRLASRTPDARSRPELRVGSLRIPRRVLLEKVPLLILALLSSGVTILAQRQALQSFEHVPIRGRVATALVSYATYVVQTFRPVGLTVSYPYQVDLPVWEIVASAGLLLSVSAAVLALRRSRPFLLVGWLWYLVALLPVIGIVQVGSQAHADRYTYLPQIGLWIVVVWGAADLTASRPLRAAAAVAAIAVSIAMAHAQASTWTSSESLWKHALAWNADDPVAHNSLGIAEYESGRVDEAFGHFQRALEIRPGFGEAYGNLGFVLVQAGRMDEGIASLRQALAIDPQLRRAQYSLGNALLQVGRPEEAIAHYEEVLRIQPNFAEVHNNLGIALLAAGRVEDAIGHLQAALATRPGYADAIHNLAWALATGPVPALRDGPRAVSLAEQANALAGGHDLVVLGTLAAAYAEADRFDDAVRTAERAAAEADAAGQGPLARGLRDQLALYRVRRAFHQEPAAGRS